MRARCRSRLIFLQEQIDFTVYVMFGLADAHLVGAEVDDLPTAIEAGQRPFEIARLENIDGFAVAQSVPATW